MRGLVLSLLFAFAASQASVLDCGAGTSVFRIDGLDFSPVDVSPGQNGTLHTQYSVPDTISAGTAVYSCAINGLPFSQSYDLCTQTACPIAAGYHDDYSISQIPDLSGKVVCKITWLDLSEKELMCIQMTFRLAAVRKGLRGMLSAVRLTGLIPNKTNHTAFNNTLALVKYTPPQQFLNTYGPQPYDFLSSTTNYYHLH
jgi:hypothetical protein